MAILPRGLVCLCAALMLAPAATAAPPPVRLFGQLPTLDEIALSPDGSRFAAIVGDDKSAQLQMRSMSDNSLLAVSQSEKAKLRDVLWVDNDHVVFTVSRTISGFAAVKYEAFDLIGIDLSKPKADAWLLLRNVKDAAEIAFGYPRALIRDGKPFVRVRGILDEQGYPTALIEVDLRRQAAYRVELGQRDTAGWLLNGDGEPVAREDYFSESGKWQLLLRTTGGWRNMVTETALIDPPDLLSFGRDMSKLVIRSHKSGEWEDYEVNLADGAMSGPVADYGDGVLIDPRSKQAIGRVDYGLKERAYRFFAPADQALWTKLTKVFAGQQLSLEAWSADRKMMILQVVGAKDGVALYQFNRATNQLAFMADRYQGIGPELLNPVTAYEYKAGDGLVIPAYLTLPKGRESAKGLPLIVLAHGGPAGRDYPGFDWWSQALASRGYAVLQPQFRGSEGFGQAHEAAGYGQWGRKMQTDLSDGVRDLVAKGVVDAGRVCIVGASYGGYAAMAGVTLDASVYRCASAVAGVSDLRRMLVTEALDAGGTRNATQRYWRRFMGAKDQNDISIDAFSPARLAERVQAPLQLIHGKDDTVVRIEQSQLMADAMKKAGKAAEFLVLEGEDHGLSRAQTRVAMLEAQVAFLEKHNPPDPAP